MSGLCTRHSQRVGTPTRSPAGGEGWAPEGAGAIVKHRQQFCESQQSGRRLGLNQKVQAGGQFPPLRLLLLFSGF